jgi:hypothetical protein
MRRMPISKSSRKKERETNFFDASYGSELQRFSMLIYAINHGRPSNALLRC